jgi:hypothetical protein
MTMAPSLRGDAVDGPVTVCGNSFFCFEAAAGITPFLLLLLRCDV